MRRKIIFFIVAVVLLIVGSVIFYKKRADAPGGSANKSKKSDQSANLSNAEAAKYTIDNPGSIYFIVNKQRPLPGGFVPKNLVTVRSEQMRSDVATAMNSLLSAAKKEGNNMHLISGYRSYTEQQKIYSGYVKKDGVAQADTYSARPGHSEHQTGLAIDLGSGNCDLQACFGETRAGKWLAEHAHEYGFIIRYEKGKENLTGYQYEPWHLRYVGTELAKKLHDSGQTMEEFFGLPAPISY